MKPTRRFLLRYIFNLARPILPIITIGLALSCQCSKPDSNQASLKLTQNEKDWLTSQSAIRVALTPDYPPMEFLDEDSLHKGIVVDYMKLFSRRLEHSFEIVPFSTWNEVLFAFDRGEVDILPAITRTPDRDESMLFTSPYIELAGVIIVRKDVDVSITLEELRGMRVAVVKGFLSEDLLGSDYEDLQFLPDIVPDVSTGLKKVSFGMVDALFTNIATASYFIQKEGITNLRVASRLSGDPSFALAVSKEQVMLHSILEKCLKSIGREERDSIFSKWVSLQKEPFLPSGEFWVILLVGVGLLFVFIVGVLIWNASLKHQVTLRTNELQAELQEKQRAQEAMKVSEDWFRTIFDGSLDAIFIVRSDGSFVDVNEAAVLLTGYNKNELQKMSIPDLHDISDLNAYNQFFHRIMSGEVITSEAHVMRKDGEKVLTEFSNRRIYIGDQPYMHTIARDITQRKVDENRIRNSLKEKEMLLQEIHHRVKNNMQVVSSLLSLQSRRLSDERIQAVMLDSQNRVRSMALIHEKLYQSNDFSNIDFDGYVRSLVQGLYRSLGIDSNGVVLSVEIHDVSLGIDKAVPCGLIINELVSNAIKYAFKPGFSNKACISISMNRVDEKHVRLIVKDNGVGIPETVNKDAPETLGLHLVNVLAKDQLMGSLNIQNQDGALFEIIFEHETEQ